MGATPNYGLLIANAWGSIYDTGVDPGVMAAISIASGVTFNQNPNFTINDFATMYPWFIGPSTNLVGSPDGSTAVIPVASITGLIVGALVTGAGIPKGSFITAIGTNNITISNNTTQAGSNITMQVYLAPVVPFLVINTYIALASASIDSYKYADSWFLAMCYFVAHYCTLYAQSAQSPNSNLAQVAMSGIAGGIMVFKHTGDLSVNLETLKSLENWGTYQLTIYGQQFASIAKVIGSGSMLVW